MRYNDETGHWELWDDPRGEWVDLYTCDGSKAAAAAKDYMNRPCAWERVPLMRWLNHCARMRFRAA